MRLIRIAFCFLAVLGVAPAVASAAEPPYWAEAMKAVHASFKGSSGYVAQFGDSITYSMAFWTPIGWDEPEKCLRLRPGLTWDNTIISQDGVHPSGGQANIYTEENMKACGYALRNWVNFRAVRELYFRVLEPGSNKKGA